MRGVWTDASGGGLLRVATAPHCPSTRHNEQWNFEEPLINPFQHRSNGYDSKQCPRQERWRERPFREETFVANVATEEEEEKNGR